MFLQVAVGLVTSRTVTVGEHCVELPFTSVRVRVIVIGVFGQVTSAQVKCVLESTLVAIPQASYSEVVTLAGVMSTKPPKAGSEETSTVIL